MRILATLAIALAWAIAFALTLAPGLLLVALIMWG